MLRRQAAAGDKQAAADMARAEHRAGGGRVWRLRRYVGRQVYIEGARMNYVGTLADVTATAEGDPAELLFSQLTRVGDWNREGINENYSKAMPASEDLPAWVPWNAVDQFSLSPWEQP